MTPADIDAWRQRRAAIIARYGSVDAATAPCERERRLLVAVEPLRTKSEEWTLAVDGWRDAGARYRSMPARALHAIQNAIPLPTSFSEAKAEDAYWNARNEELRDLLSEDGTFAEDVALDLVAEVRAAIVHDLLMHELRAGNIADLHDRLAIYRKTGINNPQVEDAVFRDIEALAAAARLQPSITRTGAAGHVTAALNADPSRSDRDIARACKCSPTTVGKARAALGLRSSTRAVSRGGQQFKMRLAAQTS